MAFYPCSNSVPTDTYTVTRNGTFDMGEIHKNRYVQANVLPAGGLSRLYYREFQAPAEGGVEQHPSVTFTAANNCLYMVVFRYVSDNKQSDWPNRGYISFGGSARYWANIVNEHTNGTSTPRLGWVVYNSEAVAFVIGNGNNVSVTWNVYFANFMALDLYQINW